MARKKNSKYKRQDLVNKVVEMACKGITQPEQLEWLQGEGGVAISFAYDILREAKPLINSALSDLYKDDKDRSIRELEELAHSATGRREYKLAFEIRKQIHKLKGLDTQKIDVTTDGEKINNIQVIKLIEIKNDDDEKNKNK